MKPDFTHHNKEVADIWDAYYKESPVRVPVQFTMNPRMVLLDPALNRWGYNWKDYLENAETRWTVDLEFQKWMRFNVVQDSEMGLPQKEWPGIVVGFQNCGEEAWFGCPLVYPADGMPSVRPIFNENKSKLYDMSPPEPFAGPIMKMAVEQYEYLNEKRKTTDYEGIPVGKPGLFGGGTDGPFSVACSLRGGSNILLDLYEDPKYVHDLLSFVTDASIKRMKKISEFQQVKYPSQDWFFADDSIELISTETYRDFVLPYHKKILAEFASGSCFMHLCGKVQRHLKFLKDELNITTFDVGFPTDMGKAREDLGEDVTLIGNIAPHLLLAGPEQEIRAAVKNVCESGVMKGGKFILREGSNCAPRTSLSHYRAMYEAGKEYGRYK